MYESFFGLAGRPFAAAPIADRYFAGAAIEAARQSVARCVDRAEGSAIVVGPAGTGKTLLCQVLAEQFRKQMEVAQLTSGRLGNRRALLQAILFELGLPYRGMEEGDLRLSLIDHLVPRGGAIEPNDQGLLLIVDEAHTLPLRLMEELRLITNLARNGKPRVRLVLVGSPQLEERFASPKLESFNQRIAVRGYLESLDRLQTAEYVKFQIGKVGGRADSIFGNDALDAVYHATDGIPRLINQVCDHALLLAYAGGARQISAAGIEEAWSDLQQLPTPWSSADGAPAIAGSADIIEFGQLDGDALEELPAAVPFTSAPSQKRTASVNLPSVDLDAGVEFASADEDFQPAGSIRPEVELTFQSLSTPFHSFDEEEVVLDRYTSIERDTLANRPLVRGPDSRELGAMLPTPAIAPPPKVAIADTNWFGGTPSALPPAEFDELDELDDDLESAYGAQEAAFDLSNRSAADQTGTVPNAAASVLSPASSVKPADFAATVNDDDLIVIEEPAERIVNVPIGAKPVAKRQEYRQLFAQLRRS